VKYWITVNGRPHEVDVTERLGQLVVAVDGETLDITYEEVDQLGQVALFVNGRSHAMSIEGDEAEVSATIDGHLYTVEIEDERERAAHAAERAAAAGGGVVKSIMPGIVVQLLVAEGDRLAILEAMKMEHALLAARDGVVAEVLVSEGAQVEAGAALIRLEDEAG